MLSCTRYAGRPGSSFSSITGGTDLSSSSQQCRSWNRSRLFVTFTWFACCCAIIFQARRNGLHHRRW
jgi:hypothetical protein